MNECYGISCRCGGISCFACQVAKPRDSSDMVCAHGKPSGIGCDECVRELGQYMNEQGYYIKGRDSMVDINNAAAVLRKRAIDNAMRVR